MVETVRLAPHDPLPGPGETHILVVARFADADPTETLVEITVNSPVLRAGPTPASRAPGGPKTLSEAVAVAEGFARERDIPRVYAVDRTAGDVESKVAEKGDRSLNRQFKDFDD